MDISEQALEKDERAVKILAGIGIPVACFLHGYAGFIFGSVKANALWMTPLMPVIFICSAVVSGIALCIAHLHRHHGDPQAASLPGRRKQRSDAPLDRRAQERGNQRGHHDRQVSGHVPGPGHHPGTARPDLPRLHGGQIVGHPAERHLRQGLLQHLHPPVRAGQPGPLHPLPAAAADHPAGGRRHRCWCCWGSS